MGSFANGVQIRADDSQAVVNAVEQILREHGYVETDEAPQGNAAYDFGSRLRGLHVTNSNNGWVGLLDSDLMNSTALAMQLSQRLETHVFQFMLHDSDFWSYLLFDHGQLIDEFDSSGGQLAEFDADAMDAMEGMGQFNQEAIAEFQQQVQDIQAAMETGMPDDIRSVHAKLQTAIQPTPEELERYSEWMQQQAERMMREMNESGLGETLFGGGSPASPSPAEDELPSTIPMFDANASPPAGDATDDDDPAGDAADGEGEAETPAEIEAHVERLGPLLSDSSQQTLAGELLQRRTIFAEEVLADFLDLLRIPSEFAYLSYDYLGEWPPEELRAAGITIERHLTFTS